MPAYILWSREDTDPHSWWQDVITSRCLPVRPAAEVARGPAGIMRALVERVGVVLGSY